MTTYFTTTGLPIDLRKLHPDDRHIDEQYPDPSTEECKQFIDSLVLDYHKHFNKLIIKKGY